MGNRNLSPREQSAGAERRGLMDALDASQSLVWFDANGMIVDANANALRMFAYAEDEILEQDYYVLCASGSKNELAEKREWGRISSGEMYHTERSYKAKNGHEVWTSVNFSAIKNEDGTTRRVVAIFIDMSRFAWKPNDASWAGF